MDFLGKNMCLINVEIGGESRSDLHGPFAVRTRNASFTVYFERDAGFPFPFSLRDDINLCHFKSQILIECPHSPSNHDSRSVIQREAYKTLSEPLGDYSGVNRKGVPSI